MENSLDAKNSRPRAILSVTAKPRFRKEKCIFAIKIALIGAANRTQTRGAGRSGPCRRPASRPRAAPRAARVCRRWRRRRPPPPLQLQNAFLVAANALSHHISVQEIHFSGQHCIIQTINQNFCKIFETFLLRHSELRY